MTIKYFNVKNGLTTGNIALHASNSSVVASTFTGNVVVTQSANLGAVSNITITGGSANYILTTDGTGNLSWIAQTGGAGAYSNSNVASYLPTYTGNVSANYFIGNGSTLTNITGSNVTGYVPNANIANSATTAGTVTTNSQPNITSVGTLTSLTVSGNTILNNVTANVVGSDLIPNANITYNLGNSTNRWKDLYLSGTSIYLGQTSITSSGSNLTFNGANVTANYYSGTDLTIAQLPITYSINFSGSNYANVTSGSGLLGSGDYTIEFWIKTTDGENGIMVSTPAGVSGHPAIFVSGNSLVFQRRYAVASTISVDITSYLNDAWHHIAFVRGSGTISLYIDGTRITTASNNDNYSAVTAGLTFGWSPQTFNYLNGYLSNFRIVNGTALYSGATLTVPTSPLTAVSGTTLLVFQSSTLVDNSSSARALTSTGSPTISSSVAPFEGYLGTGNITSGNASLGNLVTSNYFSGNGSLLTSLTGANVTGYVPNATNANSATSATTAGTVTTAAQPNITSTGTLSSLTVSGLITATGTGIKTANIQDSTGTITITTKHGNIAGDAGVYGNLTVGTSGTGNVTATYFIGNGSQLTGISGTYSNSNVASYLPTYTGNVSANYFIGNGATLTNITGSNVTGYVPNANLANTATSATTAGTVTTNAQPNITSVGSLTGLTVSGDATITGNLTVSGNTEYTNVTNLYVKDPIIEMGGGANGAPLSSNDGKDRGTLLHYYTTAPVDAFMGWDNSNGEFAFGSNVSISSEVVTFNNLGNVRAGYFIGNGSQLTGISGTYSNSNVAGYLPTYTGNVSANYFIGNGATLTNITGSNVTGQVSNALIAGTVYTNAQPNITSLGTLTELNIAGNIIPTSNVTYDLGNSAYRFRDLYLSGNTIQLGGGNISIEGNSMVLTNPIGGQFIVDGAYSEYSGVANTVSSNAQPNITSVGTLTGLTSTGIIDFSNTSNVTIGNISNLHILGGSADYVLTTDGAGNLSWEAQSGGNVSTTIAVDNFTGNGVQDTFTLSVPPSSINSVFVNYNGAFVSRGSYSLSGANLTFGSSPANGSNIEVTTIDGLPIGSGSFTTRTATGDNSTVNYTVTSGATVSSVLVTLDGVVQTPTTDYTITGSTLTFTTAPASSVAIQIRELAVAVATSTSASWTYSAINANTTAVAGYRYIVDTSSANLTITLPAAGTLGDEVMIIDGTGNSSTHAITVDRNGGKIQGLASNMTVTTDRAAFTLVYYNSTQGWILTNV